jgi:transcriptional regulator with XRE-family HTH domain
MSRRRNSGFGKRLKRLRRAAGLTQGELAERAGCHKFTIVKLEGGEREPGWPLVLALRAALGVDLAAFTLAPPEAPPYGGAPQIDPDDRYRLDGATLQIGGERYRLVRVEQAGPETISPEATEHLGA